MSKRRAVGGSNLARGTFIQLDLWLLLDRRARMHVQFYSIHTVALANL